VPAPADRPGKTGGILSLRVTAGSLIEASADRKLLRFRCSGCGYGASRRTAPDRCPMCGGSVWDFEEWRPFTQFLSALDEPLARAPRR